MKRAALGLIILVMSACETPPPTSAGGPVYDFVVASDATVATRIPGGTVTTFIRPTNIVDSVRIALRGLGAVPGGYSVFVVDDRSGTATIARTGLAPDANGVVTVTVPTAGIGTGTSVVVGFGGDFAAAARPLYFQFRNPTTNVPAATGALQLGRFEGATSTRFVPPTANRWGRGGLWLDMPQDGDIWIRGFLRHIPLAPSGFEWTAWAVDLRVDTVKNAVRLGTVTDSTGTAYASFETPPPGSPLPDLGKSVFDGKQLGLNANFLTFTHFFVTLEPRGTTATRPSPAIVYRATFPRQFTLLRPAT